MIMVIFARLMSSLLAAAKLTGSVVGVAVGCIIGMAPLMFMDTHEHDDVAAAQQDS